MLPVFTFSRREDKEIPLHPPGRMLLVGGISGAESVQGDK
jgi:hypothetical protein